MTEPLVPIPPRQLGEMVAGELLRTCWLALESGVDLDVTSIGTIGSIGSIEMLPSAAVLPWVHVGRWPSTNERTDVAWSHDYYLGVVAVLAPAEGWRKRSAAVRNALQQSSEHLAAAAM